MDNIIDDNSKKNDTRNISADSSTKSSHSENSQKSQLKQIKIDDSNCIIKEVYDDNLKEELKKISYLIEEYNYIGMDTEFPGVVYNLEKIINDDFYYKTMKKNVDSLKLIQLGITLTNKKGEYPKNYKYHTWQFNFKFDKNKDVFSNESMKLLINSGINFDKLKNNGIDHLIFAELLMTSGLVLNPEIHWVSYQGSYDFGYLLKILRNENLPKNENDFINELNLYFPNFYDLRILLKNDQNYFQGGLSKLLNLLRIERKGIMHQAGSDAIATIDCFHKSITFKIINEKKISIFRNILYGIEKGKDNINTINYINNNKKNENIALNFIYFHNMTQNKNYYNININYLYNMNAMRIMNYVVTQNNTINISA